MIGIVADIPSRGRLAFHPQGDHEQDGHVEAADGENCRGAKHGARLLAVLPVLAGVGVGVAQAPAQKEQRRIIRAQTENRYAKNADNWLLPGIDRMGQTEKNRNRTNARTWKSRLLQQATDSLHVEPPRAVDGRRSPVWKRCRPTTHSSARGMHLRTPASRPRGAAGPQETIALSRAAHLQAGCAGRRNAHAGRKCW